MTIHDILNESTKVLEAAEIPSARLDAEVLLAFYLGCERLVFFKNPEIVLGEKQIAGYQDLVARRSRWEPVAYITGRKEFWTFSLEVNQDALIPRPETEIIVEDTLDVCRTTGSTALRILDIGTGSGAIALALAKEIPFVEIIATDISASALVLARKNAHSLDLDNKIDFQQGDLFAAVDGVFDIIVSNPPYIAQDEYKELPSSVKDYEPRIALLAGKNGLEVYEKLIVKAPGYLKKNGWLLLEIGAKQEQSVRELMDESGFYDSIATRRDYAGFPRVVRARRK